MSLNDWVINQFLKPSVMLKSILKLKGAQQLNKNEQKSINGGIPGCYSQCGPTGGVVTRCLVPIGQSIPRGTICCICY